MRREQERTARITIRIFESDLEKLKLFYPRLGYNKILRAIIREHVNKLDFATQERLRKEQADGGERGDSTSSTRGS